MNTTPAVRRRVVALMALVPLVLAGCGGSSGGSSSPGGGGGSGTPPPPPPPPVSQIKAIHTSPNAAHVVVVKTDNTVWSWGLNDIGQLGPQAAGYGIVFTPMEVSALGTDFDRVALGYKTSFAYGPGVYAYGWGDNTSGVLGDNTTTARSTPTRVTVVGGFTSLASGSFTTAVRPDGTLWHWGSRINAAAPYYQPQNVGSGFSKVAMGYAHALALGQDGSVWTWGWQNTAGQLGRAVQATPSGNDAQTPVQVMTGVAQIAAGFQSSYALKTDGTLWAWGSNDKGQLGDGTTTSRAAPVQIPGLYTYISAGDNHVAATKANGTLWTWGYNNFGQLADGTTVDAWSPHQVSSAAWTMVAAGAGITLVANAAGEIYGVGYNYWGSLGTGYQQYAPTTTFTKSVF